MTTYHKYITAISTYMTETFVARQYSLMLRAIKPEVLSSIRCSKSEFYGARSTEHGSSNEFHAKCDCIPHWEYIKMQQAYGPPGDPIDVEMHECRLTDWLAQYMKSVREEVLKGEEVSGKVALRPKLVAAAVAASRGCPSCGADITELLTFAQSLGSWIDHAIDRVGACTSL